jgi:hypothetical protein
MAGRGLHVVPIERLWCGVDVQQFVDGVLGFIECQATFDLLAGLMIKDRIDAVCRPIVMAFMLAEGISEPDVFHRLVPSLVFRKRPT